MGDLQKFNGEASEPAIIVHDGYGNSKLVILSKENWAADLLKEDQKRDLLLKVGKLLGGHYWTDVQVNIIPSNNKAIIVIKREYCDPELYEGEVIYFSPNEMTKISN